MTAWITTGVILALLLVILGIALRLAYKQGAAQQRADIQQDSLDNVSKGQAARRRVKTDDDYRKKIRKKFTIVRKRDDPDS